ncbi:hypothetical protein DMX12_24735 [Pseudomonas sp. MB-090624]|nr:hypothetical protein DMX12_24735 [Pseudomonas sp. MB-090624]
MSRKGRNAAPAIFALKLKSWDRVAVLSRHKAAPTRFGCGLPQAMVASSFSHSLFSFFDTPPSRSRAWRRR